MITLNLPKILISVFNEDKNNREHYTAHHRSSQKYSTLFLELFFNLLINLFFAVFPVFFKKYCHTCYILFHSVSLFTFLKCLSCLPDSYLFAYFLLYFHSLLVFSLISSIPPPPKLDLFHVCLQLIYDVYNVHLLTFKSTGISKKKKNEL